MSVGRTEVKLQLVASPRNQFFWTTMDWLSRLRRVTPAAPLKLNRPAARNIDTAVDLPVNRGAASY